MGVWGQGQEPSPARHEEVALHTAALQLAQEVKGEAGERMAYLL